MQTYCSGAFYRDRYLTPDSDFVIAKLSPDISVPSQLRIEAPEDNVSHNSATAFLQGLYPPTNTTERLGNGSTIEAPLEGYQYIPVQRINNTILGDSLENNLFMQNNTGCKAAEQSSASYFNSKEFDKVSNSSMEFFFGLEPVLWPYFKDEELTFFNAYKSKY